AARPTRHLARARIPLSDRQLVSQPARRAWPHAAAPAVDKTLNLWPLGRWSYAKRSIRTNRSMRCDEDGQPLRCATWVRPQLRRNGCFDIEGALRYFSREGAPSRAR